MGRTKEERIDSGGMFVLLETDGRKLFAQSTQVFPRAVMPVGLTIRKHRVKALGGEIVLRFSFDSTAAGS